jgi:hypothetical protein
MFDIHCDECGQRYLVGTRAIVAFDNTPDGPVAAVRCPAGHTVVEQFRRRARRVAFKASAPEPVAVL